VVSAPDRGLDTGRKLAHRKRSSKNPRRYKRVDTCAAEFAAKTPYMYSTYEAPSFDGKIQNEARVSDRKKVVILGGGPNRIGQGIEFDYCCCHAAYAMAELDIESIMVNCNPETVSTDYDTSDRLVQFGGQTPLKLAEALEVNGIPLLGTKRNALDRAEDRERFKDLVDMLGLKQPNNAIARNAKEAKAAAGVVGYPLVLRPSKSIPTQSLTAILPKL